jgi:hypothetical protein
VSFFQILAASNSAYDIPWPPAFVSLLNGLKVLLVDVLSFVPASCTQPMNYYANMVVVLVAFKLVLACLLVGPWAWVQLKSARCLQCRFCARMSALLSRSAAWRLNESRARKARDARRQGWPEEAVKVTSLRQTLAELDWARVFKLCFMYLFFCYPGVTLKLLRMFNSLKLWVAVGITEHSDASQCRSIAACSD